MRFTLTIDMTTAAMQTGDDIQRALALTGADIANAYDGPTMPEVAGTIHDADGQPVGRWQTADVPTAEEIAQAVTLWDGARPADRFPGSWEDVEQIALHAVLIARRPSRFYETELYREWAARADAWAEGEK